MKEHAERRHALVAVRLSHAFNVDPSRHRLFQAEELARSADGEELVFTVSGRSFLRYMVRKMVGTLLDVGRGRLKPEDIDRLYESKDRSKAGPTVPPQGLVMVEVEHEQAWRIGDP